MAPSGNVSNNAGTNNAGSNATTSGNVSSNSGTNNAGNTADSSNPNNTGGANDASFHVDGHVPPLQNPDIDHLNLVEFGYHVAGGPMSNWGLDGRI